MNTPETLTITLTPDPRDPFTAPGMTTGELVVRIAELVDSLDRGITMTATVAA